MSSTNQNRKKKKNGKITAAEKQHSLQVKALHIFSARSIYFFKDTAPLPYQKSYVELLKGEGEGGGRRNLIFTLFPILTKPAQTEI